MNFLLFLLQVGLLVLWYTVAPALPWFLVFLPLLIVAGVWSIIGVVLIVAAVGALVWGR